jgi:hypothetical protein
MPPGTRALVVGLKRVAPPLIVSAAGEFGVPPSSQWFLTLGRGDQLSRNAFQLFEPGSAVPSWVLKFVRVAGYREPFDRDERGLAIAAGSPTTAAHAPRLVARFEVEGIDASLETAAVGELLKRLLESRLPRSEGIRHIEKIAAWVVEISRRTKAAPDALEAERARLLQDVVPAWAELGGRAALVHSLPPIPSVLQHNDLGCWNIVVGDGSFTALDWESARSHGLPLWDLAYFLTDALATLDGIRGDEWGRFVVGLYRGELSHSRLLFDWIRRGAEATAVPADAVGPILTLGWMHHGLSHVARGAALANARAVGYPSPTPLGKVARLWLTAPGLGPGWRSWRDGA